MPKPNYKKRCVEYLEDIEARLQDAAYFAAKEGASGLASSIAEQVPEIRLLIAQARAM